MARKSKDLYQLLGHRGAKAEAGSRGGGGQTKSRGQGKASSGRGKSVRKPKGGTGRNTRSRAAAADETWVEAWGGRAKGLASRVSRAVAGARREPAPDTVDWRMRLLGTALGCLALGVLIGYSLGGPAAAAKGDLNASSGTNVSNGGGQVPAGQVPGPIGAQPDRFGSAALSPVEETAVLADWSFWLVPYPPTPEGRDRAASQAQWLRAKGFSTARIFHTWADSGDSVWMVVVYPQSGVSNDDLRARLVAVESPPPSLDKDQFDRVRAHEGWPAESR